jgi:eukaryotic-like serine/threonine-protein kinase
VPENRSPSSTASNSAKLNPTEDLPKKEEPCCQSVEPPPGRSTSTQCPNQRPSKKTSPVRQRLILWGLGGAGVSFAGLLLKNLFDPQLVTRKAPVSIPNPISTPSSKGDATGIAYTVQFVTVKLDNQGNVVARPIGKIITIKEFLGNGVSLTMVKVPAGSFMMGSPLSEEESEKEEKPQHKVYLKAFYLGQTEVTQAQYQVIMGNNPSNFKGTELPVEQVSLLDAKEFCKRLSQKTGRTYSLPSESQWEYACRAGTTTPFAYGDTITTDTANYDGNYIYGKAPKGINRKKTTVVTTFPPNV